MLIFVYHGDESNKSHLEDIVDNHENVKFISISDFLDNNYDNSTNKLVLIVARVIKSKYGRHPKKGNYMKLYLTDVAKGKGKSIGIYMYKKAVIREKIQNGDLVGLARSNLNTFSAEFLNGDSEQVFEVVYEDKMEATLPVIWVLTRSSPLHTYDYTPLNEVKENERHAVFGVVISKEPVSETRGTSFVCCLKIKDKSLDGEFNLNIFLNEKNDLPEINIGDIIQCYIKGGLLNSRPCGTVFAPKQCVIWSNNIYGHLVPRTSASAFAMTVAEEKIVMELRQWIADTFLNLLFVTPGKETKSQNLSLQSLSGVKKGSYFDFLCQVVEVFPVSNKSVVLRVWDGTKPNVNQFFQWCPPSIHQFSSKHTLINDYVVDVLVHGDHCEVASRLNLDDIILIRNVHCSAPTNEANKMRLQLHEGSSFGRAIVICNSGQCVALKRKLDDVLATCEDSAKQLFSPVRDHFQSSFEMHTQDLSPDLHQKVMERRAKEKELCRSLIFQDDKGDEVLDTVNEVLESVDDAVSDQLSKEIDLDTNNTHRLEVNCSVENGIDSHKQRRGRWFILVLKSTKGEENKENEEQKKKETEEDIKVDGVFPYKRNNHVVDTIDLTMIDDSDEESPTLTTNSSTSSQAGRITIELSGNEFPLSTLENVAFSELGHKHRIRVKVRDVEPSPLDCILNSLHLQCPICQYSHSYAESKEAVCGHCFKINPLHSFMKCVFYVKFLVQDRTGSLPVWITGSDAELFFGMEALQLLECKQSRKELEDKFNWICSDYSDCSDILNCKNPWLDLIVQTVDKPQGLSHFIINTKCNIQLSPTKIKPSRPRKPRKRQREN